VNIEFLQPIVAFKVYNKKTAVSINTVDLRIDIDKDNRL